MEAEPEITEKSRRDTRFSSTNQPTRRGVKKGPDGPQPGKALKRALAEVGADGRTAMDSVVENIVAEGQAGNSHAWRLIFEYVEGKPVQPVDVGSDPERPLRIQDETERRALIADTLALARQMGMSVAVGPDIDGGGGEG